MTFSSAFSFSCSLLCLFLGLCIEPALQPPGSSTCQQQQQQQQQQLYASDSLQLFPLLFLHVSDFARATCWNWIHGYAASNCMWTRRSSITLSTVCVERIFTWHLLPLPLMLFLQAVSVLLLKRCNYIHCRPDRTRWMCLRAFCCPVPFIVRQIKSCSSHRFLLRNILLNPIILFFLTFSQCVVPV